MFEELSNIKSGRKDLKNFGFTIGFNIFAAIKKRHKKLIQRLKNR